MAQNLEVILSKLTRFIKSYYVNELIKGTLLFLAIGLLYFLLVLVLENFLWLSTDARRILFWLFISVEVFLFIKFIGISLAKLFKLGKQISHLEASSIIGTHFPEVKDQLVNLLQLNNTSEKSELLQASIDQKSKTLSPIPFNVAINFKKSFGYAKYALIPLVCFLLFTFFSGKNWYKESFKRVINYDTAYEAPAPFYFKVLNENLNSLQNDNILLKVSTYGKVVPEQVFVKYGNETYLLKKESTNLFSYEFKNVVENISFKLFSADQYSKEYNLNVNPAPSIIDFKMKINYPSHVKQVAKTINNSGNATVPEGSKIEWFIKANNTSKLQLFEGDIKTSFIKKGTAFSHSKRFDTTTEYDITSSNKHAGNYEKLTFKIDVIKDQNPSITVKVAQDTTRVNQQLFYGQVSDDYGLNKLEVAYYKHSNPDQVERKKININNGTFSDFTFKFPNDLHLEDATSYAYYFEVFDNDAVRGSKSSKSQVFNYTKLSKINEEKQSLKNDQQQLDQFSKSLEEFQNSDLDLKSFTKFQKQKSALSFKDKKKLSDVLEKQSKQQKKLKDLSEKLEKTLDKLKSNLRSELTKEQLERTKMQLEENKKLVDEIKKAMEKLTPKQLQEKTEKLEKENKKLNKNLNQILELTKRYYVIEKHTAIVEMLELLSQKQEKLAESESLNKTDEQQKINNDFKIIQDELNDLRKSNNQLKKPMKLDDDPAYEERINDKLKEALKDLENKKEESAKTKQKTGAIMLQNLADKMSTEPTGESPEELEEDTEMLRQILDNLVLYSFDEESTMNSFKTINSNNPEYSKYIRKQQVLVEHFEHIDDSLFALASRNPKVGIKVNDLIAEIDQNMSSSLAYLTENQTSQGAIFLQYAVTHANDLSLMLSKTLGQMNAQKKPGKGKPKKSKGQGFQLPDIIKKQESLNKAMQKMLEGGGEKKPGESGKEEQGGEKKPGNKGKAGEEGKKGAEGKSGEEGEKGEQGSSGKNGKSGESGESGEGGKNGKGKGAQGSQGQGGRGENSREGKGGKNGQTANDGEQGKGENKGKKGNGNGEGDEPSEEESDYGQLFEIYKQQQQLRNQLADQIEEQGLNKDKKRILSQMEQVENELLENGFNKETLNRMLNLKHQLFKLKEAQFQQGKDSKRKSETNKNDSFINQEITPEQIKQYFNSTEILNRQVLPLQPEFKKKVQEYFISPSAN